MKTNIAVVIPCYQVERSIKSVVDSIPEFVKSIILVDDCSKDSTKDVLLSLAEDNSKITILLHDKNKGVGGAMLTGFQEAIRINSEIVVKLDGDGQMDSSYIEKMVNVLSKTSYTFVKGNRFFDRKMLKKMPAVRRFGNMWMSFLIKIASGYWHISDPTNGFFCVKTENLKRIDFKRISNRFFFESSLLIELFYTGARIKDISMPAIYADEKSNLSVFKTLVSFPQKLLKAYIRRIYLQYFVYDFNIVSLYYLCGLPLFLFGLIFGIVEWISFARIGTTAPTGTIMVSILPLILGFQLLLSAVQSDIMASNPFEVELDD